MGIKSTLLRVRERAEQTHAFGAIKRMEYDPQPIGGAKLLKYTMIGIGALFAMFWVGWISCWWNMASGIHAQFEASKKTEVAKAEVKWRQWANSVTTKSIREEAEAKAMAARAAAGDARAQAEIARLSAGKDGQWKLTPEAKAGVNAIFKEANK